MRIAVFGNGNVGGGLADLWERAGHQVTCLGRDGGENADDPGMRHVAYRDERGSPGSIVTFFDSPASCPARRARGWSTRWSSGWRARRRTISGSAAWITRGWPAIGWPIAWCSQTRRVWGSSS